MNGEAILIIVLLLQWGNCGAAKEVHLPDNTTQRTMGALSLRTIRCGLGIRRACCRVLR
jgi:hypothetical protein